MQGASTTYPRAIVGSPEGGFFMTFNGHPSQKGYNEIEIIGLDRNQEPTKWVTAVITQEKGKLSFEKNVKKCSACHGDPIKPLWGKYPSWPNAFGSVDDWLPDPKNLGKDSKLYEQDIVGNDYEKNKDPRLTKEDIQMAQRESEQFRAFRSRAKNHPRYSSLEEASDKNNPVYPYTEVYRIRNNAYRPNLLIGTMMTVRQNEILLRRISQDPIFNRFKNSFLHYYKCYKTGTSDEHNKTLHQLFSDFYKIKYQIEMPLYSDKLSSNYSDHFLDLFGVHPHEKTLLFASDINFLDEYERSYSSGYQTIIYTIISELLENQIKTWSDKEKYLIEGAYHDPYDDLETYLSESPYRSYILSEFLGREMLLRINNTFGGTFISASNQEYSTEEQKRSYTEMCTRLERHSKIEVANESSNTILFTPKPITKNPWPKALNTCIECHDNGKNTVATPIPFKNPTSLNTFGTNFESIFGWGNLFDSTSMLTLESMKPSHLNGHRMPLGHAPLTQDERRGIMDWINPDSQ